MSYTAFKDGYAIEAAYGTTTTIQQATQTYLWGAISQKAVHPSPRTTVGYRAVSANAAEVPAGAHYKNYFDLSGMYAVGLQNGIPIWAALGASSTVGTDPYTHTITAGTTIPSFSIQHERTGTATAWATQFTGCKVGALTLTCGQEQRYLIGRMDWIAQKARDPAFVLDNDPVLAPTATTDPYKFAGMTRTYNAASIDGLIYMELSISPDLSSIRVPRWDAGTWVGQWLYQLLEAPRRKYKLTIHVASANDDMWDSSVATTLTDDFVFKWTKSTNDYIQITCTDCPITFHELSTPEEGLGPAIDVIECEPRSLSVEVKDSIVGGYYGE